MYEKHVDRLSISQTRCAKCQTRTENNKQVNKEKVTTQRETPCNKIHKATEYIQEYSQNHRLAI